LVIFRDAYALTTGQTDWLKETETQVYKLLAICRLVFGTNGLSLSKVLLLPPPFIDAPPPIDAKSLLLQLRLLAPGRPLVFL
jgi:hypothetical protein